MPGITGVTFPVTGHPIPLHNPEFTKTTAGSGTFLSGPDHHLAQAAGSMPMQERTSIRPTAPGNTG